MTTQPTFERAPTTTPHGHQGVDGVTSVRAAALGGAIFVALILVFAALTTKMPAATDTRQEVFDYLTRHHDRVQLAASVYALAMPAALLFVSGLFRVLRAAEGGRPRLAVAALAGGVLAAASTVTSALILGTTGSRYTDLGPGGSRVFWTMFLLSVGGTLLGQVLTIGITGVISLRAHVFGRWFGVASIVLALASAAGAWTIGYPDAAWQVTAGAALIADGVWMGIVSVKLWRRPELALP